MLALLQFDSASVPLLERMVEAAEGSGGGTSPVVVVVILVGLTAIAGGLYAFKERQRRPGGEAPRSPTPAASPASGAERHRT